MILTKQLTKMFPEQLGGLSTWKELSIPSILIHLAPEKFAQLDFKRLDKYLSKEDNYADMENVRYLFNRFVAVTKDSVPGLIEKILTPELEQQLRSLLKSSTFSEKISNVFPNSDRLNYEWLFDRMILKLRAMKRDQQHHTETTTSEPTTTLEMHSTTDNKCTWGPILCSINRVSFQRKVEVSKRIG